MTNGLMVDGPLASAPAKSRFDLLRQVVLDGVSAENSKLQEQGKEFYSRNASVLSQLPSTTRWHAIRPSQQGRAFRFARAPGISIEPILLEKR